MVSFFEVEEDGFYGIFSEVEASLSLEPHQAVGEDGRTLCGGAYEVGFDVLCGARGIGYDIGAEVGFCGCVRLRIGAEYACALAQADVRLAVCNARYHSEYAAVVLGAEVYGLVVGIAGQQPPFALLVLVIDLDGHLAVDGGDDKVAAVGTGAGGDNQFVAVVEIEVAHRLSPDGYDESRLACVLAGYGYGLVGVVAGQGRQACPHSAWEIRHPYPIHYL